MTRHKNVMFDSRHLPKCERHDPHGGGGRCGISLRIDRIAPGQWRVRCYKCRFAIEAGTYDRALESWRTLAA